MSEFTRRKFLRGSTRTIVAMGLGSLALRRPARAVPASEKLNFAAIGVGGRCSSLIKGFLKRRDVQFNTLCDVYPRRDRLEKMQSYLESQHGKAAKIEQDYRRVLDDKSIDAVIIGTPDHWHAPLTIFSCQAGKDVYVEKPPTHNIWEGRKMVEAATRYKRIVQTGTQNRSAPYVQKALEFVRGGGIGDVHLAKVYNMKGGGPFDPGQGGTPPDGMDYDTWLGPASERPFNKKTCYGGGWHKYWDFSGGDMADDGVHQLDIARMLIDKAFPEEVHSTGGNFAFKDSRDVPDTQVVTYKFDTLVMTFELTQYANYMAKTNGQSRFGHIFPHWPQNATRIELYGTKNLMILGRHGGGWQVFTKKGKLEEEMHGKFPDLAHQENFVQSIRSRNQPNANPEEGHRSAALVHLANISYRLGGRRLKFDPKTESFIGDKEANTYLKREYRKRFEIPEII